MTAQKRVPLYSWFHTTRGHDEAAFFWCDSDKSVQACFRVAWFRLLCRALCRIDFSARNPYHQVPSSLTKPKPTSTQYLLPDPLPDLLPGPISGPLCLIPHNSLLKISDIHTESSGYFPEYFFSVGDCLGNTSAHQNSFSQCSVGKMRGTHAGPWN